MSAHQTPRRRLGLLVVALCASSGEAFTVPRVRASRPILTAAATPASPAPANAQGAAVAWGVCGFLGILASAIGRLAPIALQPFFRRDMSLMQWGMYGGSMAMFAYVEGYGAFQKKFSPLVVERAATLKQGGSPTQVILAPFYSMGLFHSTRKRKITSWSVSIGVAMLVGFVKRLPYPWRSVVDAGVCTGLIWGATSIIALYARAIRGKLPGVDACLP